MTSKHFIPNLRQLSRILKNDEPQSTNDMHYNKENMQHQSMHLNFISSRAMLNGTDKPSSINSVEDYGVR